MRELIAIVEDEEDILELLEYNLKKEGFDVEGFLDASRIEDLLKTENVDLMIVDRNLPGIEGAKMVSTLRNKGFQTPVIFLTAKNEEVHRIEGYESGGDDYITKPFNIKELILRVKAVLRRTTSDKESLQHKDIMIFPTAQKVYVEDEEILLTKLEFNLLCELIRNKNIVLTRESLLASVWDGNDIFQDRTVDVAIKRLKEKIDPERKKEYILSVRGVGYKLC